ncbi:SurA N-terminal domain-containing protein [Brachybacterium sp. J144]|uniref:SurA N-terminal domain-containing protein n=1 Tax=Brachybacterium sp. J144 TaxID=3116487 RepID=UPI002E779EDF|nr:SurA N-terminal domain-containing protein [Brachybacterium sp. J144]MEE1652034.1 SurA N-terminal domain-containing protein [Brachybacterium sp. J144]
MTRTSTLRTRAIARAATAVLAVGAALGLAACGPEQSASSGASDAGGDAPVAASDGDGEQALPQADTSAIPEVVAEVNGEQITRDDFVPVYESQYQQAAAQTQTTGESVDEAGLQQQVADQLVDNLLLQQAATKAGIEATDADIDATLDQIAQQNGLGSGDEVVQTLVGQGYSEEQVREDAATQYELTTFVTQEGGITEPAEEELRAQYDDLVAQQEQSGADASQVPPFEEVREQLAQQALTQQQNEAATTLAAELREQGDVTILL